MPTKTERFNQWRREFAAQEQNYLNGANHISHFVDRVEHLETIKNAFSNHHTSHYKRLAEYGNRAVVTVLYSALVFQELSEELPPGDTQERQLFMALTKVLSSMYLDGIHNAAQNIKELMANLNKFLDLELTQFSDLHRVKKICFALYTVLHLLQLALTKLDWKKRAIISFFVDVEKMREQLGELINKTGFKLAEVNQVLANSSQAGEVEKKNIQEYFNAQYTGLLNTEVDNNKKLKGLTTHVDKVIDGLTHLRTIKNKKEDDLLKGRKIHNLLDALDKYEKENNRETNFLKFAASQKELLEMLLHHTDGLKKEQLIADIAQLEHPTRYQKASTAAIDGLSRATSFFGRLTPENLRKIVASNVAKTLEHQCRANLKDLAKEYLIKLQVEIKRADDEIDERAAHLSRGDTASKKLLISQPVDELNKVLEANHALKKALAEYSKIYTVLKEKKALLTSIQNADDRLTEFINAHDGFWVWLSNLFAQLCSFFKSETAALIDQANELQAALIIFEERYQEEINQELKQIKSDPEIPDAIRTELIAEFDFDELFIGEQREQATPNRQEIQGLIRNFSNVFGNLRQTLNTEAAADPEQGSALTLSI